MPRPAKYTAVADALRQQIDAGRFAAGELLPTEQELAGQYGISRLTLRKALAQLEAEELVVRRSGAGTVVRHDLVPAAAGQVLYVGQTQDHYFTKLYEALCSEARSRGFTVGSLDADAAARRRDVLQRSRRLVCVEDAWPRIEPLVAADAHVTCIGGFYGISRPGELGRAMYVVSSDTYRAIGLAVDHLVSLGHRRIALVDHAHHPGPTPWRGRIHPRRSTYLGYCSALLKAGIRDERVIGVPTFEVGSRDWQIECLRHYLAEVANAPTAFVCAQDFQAGALLRALKEEGYRVPADASVVGLGDTPWTEWLAPPLTSVRLGEAEMARLALILTQEPVPDAVRLVRIEPEVVVRHSCGPPPAEE